MSPMSTSGAVTAPEVVGLASTSKVQIERTATESEVTLIKEIDPGACSGNDLLSLGQLLEWMDAASCLSAERHCGRYAVTLVMDDLDFVAEGDELLRRGQMCVLEGKVTRAFGSSLEVRVNVAAADIGSGALRPYCHAYFMYVVLATPTEKASRTKLTAPGLLPQNVDEQLEHSLADQRRNFRKQREDCIQELCSAETVETHSPTGEEYMHRHGFISFTELVMPAHANHMGNTFGGQIMAWMAKGASAAIWLHLRRHCGNAGEELGADRLKDLQLCPVSIDQIHFKGPSHVGDRVQVSAQVTRAFGSSLEVRIRVTSAGVDMQDFPVEVNVGYFTYCVKNNGQQLTTALPDIVPQTVEQREEYRRAAARQQFRLQRRDTSPKPDALSPSNFSVDFDPNSRSAQKLAEVCISSVLRVKGSTELSWETLPGSGEGIRALVQFGLGRPGALTRFKLAFTIQQPPKDCFDMLQDVSRRKEWDQTCVECTSQQRVAGADAELVLLVLAAPATQAAFRDVSGQLPKTLTGAMAMQEILLLRAWRADEHNKSFVIGSRSVRCDSTPPGPNRRRGEVMPSGYIIQESPQSAGASTDITFVGQCDQMFFEFARPHLLAQCKRFCELMEKSSDEYPQKKLSTLSAETLKHLEQPGDDDIITTMSSATLIV